MAHHREDRHHRLHAMYVRCLHTWDASSFSPFATDHVFLSLIMCEGTKGPNAGGSAEQAEAVFQGGEDILDGFWRRFRCIFCFFAARRASACCCVLKVRPAVFSPGDLSAVE